MRFEQFTDESGNLLFVNLDTVAMIEPAGEDRTRLIFSAATARDAVLSRVVLGNLTKNTKGLIR